MAHSLHRAIDDFIDTLKHALDIVVSTEATSVPNRTTLFISVGDLEEIRGFGQFKYIQNLDLELNVLKSKNTARDVSELCRHINTLITEDACRGGFAATTINDIWTTSDNDGRDGVVMVSSPAIHVVEARLK